VTIKRIEITAWDGSDPARPVATVEVQCSAGTYIRALARDMGERLGSGAYLAALTRTASGPFRLDGAHALEEVREAMSGGRAKSLLLPMDTGLDFPEVTLQPAELVPFARGQQLRRAGTLPGEGLVRVRDIGGRLVAIARAADGVLAPEKVFAA
jgi:tRNA pseudouridine55 synthase